MGKAGAQVQVMRNQMPEATDNEFQWVSDFLLRSAPSHDKAGLYNLRDKCLKAWRDGVFNDFKTMYA